MVALIVKFLHGSSISLTAYMDDFIYQEICECKAIFEIHVIALVFMCWGWSIYWVKTILEPTRILLHLSFLWDTMGKTIARSPLLQGTPHNKVVQAVTVKLSV